MITSDTPKCKLLTLQLVHVKYLFDVHIRCTSSFAAGPNDSKTEKLSTCMLLKLAPLYNQQRRSNLPPSISSHSHPDKVNAIVVLEWHLWMALTKLHAMDPNGLEYPRSHIRHTWVGIKLRYPISEISKIDCTVFHYPQCTGVSSHFFSP